MAAFTFIINVLLARSNKIINVLAGIFSEENQLDNCILLNHKKNVVEFYNGNLFFVKNNSMSKPDKIPGNPSYI